MGPGFSTIGSHLPQPIKQAAQKNQVTQLFKFSRSIRSAIQPPQELRPHTAIDSLLAYVKRNRLVDGSSTYVIVHGHPKFVSADFQRCGVERKMAIGGRSDVPKQ